jgi:hypothetical protein
MNCKCSGIAQSVLGDGCYICNPELANELEKEIMVKIYEWPNGDWCYEEDVYLYALNKSDDYITKVVPESYLE